MSAVETSISPMLDLTYFKKSGMNALTSKRVLVIPENQSSFTAAPSQTTDVYFSLPSNAYAMWAGHSSYLAFDFKVETIVGSLAVALQNGDAGSLIRQIQVVIGGQVVENIDHYNVMSNIVSDFASAGKATTLNTILSGSGGVKIGKPMAALASQRLVLPLLLGTIGTLQNNLMYCAESIRVQITFESPNCALVGAAGTTSSTYSISNLGLYLEQCSVPPAIMDAIWAESGGQLKTHICTVSNYSSSLTAGATTNTVTIPHKSASLKHIWNCFRASPNISAPILVNTTGSRQFNSLKSFSYSCSGTVYPQNEVRCLGNDGATAYGAEAMTEFLKTMSNWANPYADCVFNETQYLSTAVGVAGVASSFVMGYDFETESSTGDQINGLNTNSSNIYLNLVHSAAMANDSYIDSFCFFDETIIVNRDGSVAVSR